MATVVACAHWSACVWALQVALFETDLSETWLVNFGYCVPINANSTSPLYHAIYNRAPPLPSALPSDTGYGYVCTDAVHVYMASLYFATMTLVSVGYGDIAATPQNASEQAVCVLMMMISGAAWASFTGNFFA